MQRKLKIIKKRQTDSDRLEQHINQYNNISELEKKIKAGLLANQVDSVDREAAFKSIKEKIKSKKEDRYSIFNLIRNAAAILAIPLLLGSIWFYFNYKNEIYQLTTETLEQEIEIPPGMRSQVILPDGSSVWLNAGSKIKYSFPFVKNKREIELSGEGYFNVAKNENSPFIVKSGETFVKVLGTKFNLKAYPDEENVEIALKEGSVKFIISKGENRCKYYEMHPNEFLTYNKVNEISTLYKTNVNKYIAWHNNTLILDETPMRQVAVLLERWYGVKVEYDKQIEHYRFNTTFENESLFKVLELLELSSPISIKYLPAKVDEDTKILGKSIVLITKK